MMELSTPGQGAGREVGVDELFFSTTDDRGVIGLANGVFSKISGYPIEQLQGTPHNVVRHEEMPGGAFKVMWDALSAGRPFAGYVRNRAIDGRHYDVLATVTPLPDGGYLSVRSRPILDSLFETVLGAYAGARQEEQQRRAGGTSAREAAEIGAGALAQAVVGLGHEDYEAFQNVLLPAEVMGREEQSRGLPQRPGASGRYADGLLAARQVHEALDEWMRQQDTLQELSDALSTAGVTLARETADLPLDQSTLDLLTRSGGRAASLVEPLQIWLQMQGIVSTATSALTTSLTNLGRTTSRMRFLVALSRLHADTVARFAAELIDGEMSPGSAEGHSPLDQGTGEHAIRILIQALRQAVADMHTHAGTHSKLVDDTAAQIARVSMTLQIPRQLLQLATLDLTPDQLNPDVAEVVPRITESIARTGRTIDQLGELAEKCRTSAVTGDEELLRSLLQQIEVTVS